MLCSYSSSIFSLFLFVFLDLDKMFALRELGTLRLACVLCAKVQNSISTDLHAPALLWVHHEVLKGTMTLGQKHTAGKELSNIVKIIKFWNYNLTFPFQNNFSLTVGWRKSWRQALRETWGNKGKQGRAELETFFWVWKWLAFQWISTYIECTWHIHSTFMAHSWHISGHIDGTFMAHMSFIFATRGVTPATSALAQCGRGRPVGEAPPHRPGVAASVGLESKNLIYRKFL